ncbi:hypothetical protein SAMN06265222_10610 [Neorhodopirellula lusitana]|uniref:Uncharacterized protein n=1 Tax=Neorhodopirellula lusitana TaxID=445327 RepID=A0ABY1Q469_9BACT|nr:hypothetical protein SAMN06265222_10610 [Neorhodopirellula lusitana]
MRGRVKFCVRQFIGGKLIFENQLEFSRSTCPVASNAGLYDNGDKLRPFARLGPRDFLIA